MTVSRMDVAHGQRMPHCGRRSFPIPDKRFALRIATRSLYD